MPYGLKDGALVGADEVERGLACGAVCPVCNGPLIARKGEKREFHFAHHTSCDCAYGPETSFHLMAKRVIAERKTLRFPHAGSKEMLKADPSLWTRQDVDHEPFFDELPFVPAREAVFSGVQVEQSINKDGVTIIPDLIATDAVSGETILLEFLVTHEVDDTKHDKVRTLGHSCLEIDLRPFVKRWCSKVGILEEFPDWLIHEVENKKWIYYRPLEIRLDERRKLVQRTHAEILSLLESTRSTAWHRVPYEEWDNSNSEWRPVPAKVDPARPFFDQRCFAVTWRIDLDIPYWDQGMRRIAKQCGCQWDPARMTWYYPDNGGVMSYNGKYYFSSIPTRLRTCAKQGTWTRIPMGVRQ